MKAQVKQKKRPEAELAKKSKKSASARKKATRQPSVDMAAIKNDMEGQIGPDNTRPFHSSASGEHWIRRPLSVWLIGSIYILIPFANLLNTMHRFHTGWVGALLRLSLLAALLLLSAPAVGIAILLMRRWAYRAFLVHGGLVLLYNIYSLFLIGGSSYRVALIRSLLGLSIAWFFLRRQFQSPYFLGMSTGMNRTGQPGIVVPVQLGGVDTNVLALSSESAFISGNLSGKIEREKIYPGTIHLPDGEVSFQARILSLTETGFGVQIRKIDKANRRRLADFARAHSAAQAASPITQLFQRLTRKTAPAQEVTL